MSDSTRSGHVGHERAARAPELVVEPDTCRQAEKTLGDTLTQPLERAGAVTLQGEQVLAGPEDRLDALADQGQVRSAAGLIAPRRSHDRGPQSIDGVREGAPGIALVAHEDPPLTALEARDELPPDLALIALGAAERERPRGAVGGEDGVQPKAPEVAAVAGAVAVVGGIGQSRAAHRLAAAGALHPGGVRPQPR